MKIKVINNLSDYARTPTLNLRIRSTICYAVTLHSHVVFPIGFQPIVIKLEI